MCMCTHIYLSPTKVVSGLYYNFKLMTMLYYDFNQNILIKNLMLTEHMENILRVLLGINLTYSFMSNSLHPKNNESAI